jgi:hypothetical protein
MKKTTWVEPSNHKEFFDYLGNQMNYKTLDDFYNLSMDSVKMYGGASLLENFYGNTLTDAMQDIYPHHTWYAWKFSQNVKPRFWESNTQERIVLDLLGNQLGFKRMEDWYNVTVKQIREKGGSKLLRKYDNSPSKLVASVYNHHQWINANFNSKPRGYWHREENQRKFLDELGQELGFKDMNDWYSISWKQIIDTGASCLLKFYGGSPSKMVKSVYNSHEWKDEKFTHKAKEYWEIKDNHRNFLDILGKELGFKQITDWYNVSIKQIRGSGGSGILNKYGILIPNDQ